MLKFRRDSMVLSTASEPRLFKITSQSDDKGTVQDFVTALNAEEAVDKMIHKYMYYFGLETVDQVAKLSMVIEELPTHQVSGTVVEIEA